MPILPDHALERLDRPLPQHGGTLVLLETPDPHPPGTGLEPHQMRIVEHGDRPLVRQQRVQFEPAADRLQIAHDLVFGTTRFVVRDAAAGAAQAADADEQGGSVLNKITV